MRDARRTLPLLALLALAACGSPVDMPEPEGEHPLQTGRLEYTLRRSGEAVEVAIGYRYTNRTGRRVYLVNCLRHVPPALEKLQEGEWVPAWSAVVPACLSAPIVIEPGRDYADTLHVHAGLPGSRIAPRFSVAELEGVYRLVWHMAVHDYDDDRQGFGDPLPLEHRVSNSFLLRAP